MLFQPGQINVVFSLGTKILGELDYKMVYHAKNLFEAMFFIIDPVSIGSRNYSITCSLREYAIPKIIMLYNLSCLKARFRLLRNKLSTAQQPEPRFKTA